MIQIYSSNNKSYSRNGDMILNPNSCKITRKLATGEQNFVFNLELVHNLDKEGRWKYIENENIIKAPTPAGEQLFRIYKTVKTNYSITAYAEHLIFDLKHKIITFETHDESLYGLKNVLDKSLKGTLFKHNINFDETFTGECKYMSVFDMLLGNYQNNLKEDYVIDVDNFNIKLIYYSIGIGEDKGFRADFGYNLNEIEETIDYTDLVTRIIAHCNRTVGDSEDDLNVVVDSKNIGKYKNIYEKYIEYQISFEDEDSATEDDYINALEFKAEKEYEDNNVDLPIVNYKVNIEDLRNTTIYKKYKQLEQLQIGDIVYCRHNKLNITTNSRMIAYEYDSVNEKYIKQELGDFIPNFIQLLKKKI